jgi:MFS family permease
MIACYYKAHHGYPYWKAGQEPLNLAGSENNRDERTVLDVLHGRFPALRSRNFRLLWIGSTISAAGGQMQFWAINWQIYDLTHSYVALGLIGLFRIVPIFVFSLLGGAVADAADRRRILFITQTVLMVVAGALGLLTHLGAINAFSIYLLTAVGAAAISFNNPARQSLLPNLVPREHFANAASLNSIAMQIASIVGPVLAGQVIAHMGLSAAYWCNSVSFVAVLIALALMGPTVAVRADDARGEVSLDALREGLVFVWRTPILVSTILLDFFATFFSSANALLPVFAKDILRVGAQGYGVLAGASAAGSLAAGSVMALRRRIVRQGPTVLWAVVFYGLATVVFGMSRWFWLSWLALAAAGASDTVSTILRQTIRQLITPDHLRGRMTSVNMIFFMGGPQLGELEAGLVANWLGAPWSVITGGLGCLAATLAIAVRAASLRQYNDVDTFSKKLRDADGTNGGL